MDSSDLINWPNFDSDSTSPNINSLFNMNFDSNELNFTLDELVALDVNQPPYNTQVPITSTTANNKKRKFDVAEPKPQTQASLTFEQEKERKSFREKQRRAELNSAFTALAATLNLSTKTEKTSLVKAADKTVRDLQSQVKSLKCQLAFFSFLPSFAGGANNGNKEKEAELESKLPELLLLKNEFKGKGKSCGEGEDKVVAAEDTGKSLQEMKSLVEKVETLYRSALREQAKNEGEITHSHCA